MAAPTTQQDMVPVPLVLAPLAPHLSAFFSNLAPVFDILVKEQLGGYVSKLVTGRLGQCWNATCPQETLPTGGAWRMVSK